MLKRNIEQTKLRKTKIIIIFKIEKRNLTKVALRKSKQKYFDTKIVKCENNYQTINRIKIKRK
jgi:hypothetical protein